MNMLRKIFGHSLSFAGCSGVNRSLVVGAGCFPNILLLGEGAWVLRSFPVRAHARGVNSICCFHKKNIYIWSFVFYH